MLRVTTLCAAAGLALAALATSPAQASYQLLHWDQSGFCQVWNNDWTIKPFPSDFKKVGKPLPTITAALDAKNGMVTKGKCKF